MLRKNSRAVITAFGNFDASCPRIACSKNGVALLAYVAGIHVLGASLMEDVDGRDKPGHDEVSVGRAEMERQDAPPPWDRDADVVVIGSGATGLPAAIIAREAGASVIVVEAQPHIGGHAITSGGNLPLGGGTS